MSRLFRLDGTCRRDPRVAAWFDRQSPELGELARTWFQALRECGEDVREVLHDGHPTVCLGDAAFAYVNAFSRHVNLGFFQGSSLEDPAGLLRGSGKWMRHVRIQPGQPVDGSALRGLIEGAYRDLQERMAPGSGSALP